MAQKSVMDNANKLVPVMEEQYKKLPSLPANVRDILVTVTPWVTLVFGALGLLGALTLFGLTTVLAPILVLGGGVRTTAGLSLGIIIWLLANVLMLVAVPGLFKKRLSGWTLLFWSEVVGVVASLLSFDLVGVVFALVGFYILFQIKHYYK